MQSGSMNFSCSIFTKISAKLYRMLGSQKKILSTLLFENITVNWQLSNQLSEIYKLQLDASYYIIKLTKPLKLFCKTCYKKVIITDFIPDFF